MTTEDRLDIRADELEQSTVLGLKRAVVWEADGVAIGALSDLVEDVSGLQFPGRIRSGHIPMSSSTAGCFLNATSSQIDLPRYNRSSGRSSEKPIAKKLIGATPTILLVEDYEPVLEFGSAVIEDLGYVVLTASTPVQALQLVEQHTGDIHLVITDVAMPEMNGRELMEKLCIIKPGIKCLYMSGYTADEIASQYHLEEGIHYIQKPFKLNDLADIIRKALDV
jgi:CheY-like chemotaxis protein